MTSVVDESKGSHTVQQLLPMISGSKYVGSD